MFGLFKKKTAVNQKDADIAKSIAMVLQVQFALTRSDPDKVREDWPICYVGSFAEHVCCRKGVAQEDRHTISRIVFGCLFDDKPMDYYFNRYLNLRAKNSSELCEAAELAVLEADVVLDGSSNKAFGITAYCHGFLDKVWSARKPPNNP